MLIKKILVAVSASFVLFASSTAHAGLTFFNDVSTFTNSLSTFKTDSLDGVAGMWASVIARPDFDIFAPSTVVGCNSQGGSSNPCGNNLLIGFDDAFLYLYDSNQTFTFNSAVNGFGFTYAVPVGSTMLSPPFILGVNEPGAPTMFTQHFFGVISDEKMTTFTGVGGVHLIIDNITYGVTAVPEPETYVLLLSGLWLMGAIARRRMAKQTA